MKVRCRSVRATTSTISCVACSRIPVPTAQSSATSSSTRRQRQVELHRLARPPAHRAAEGWHGRTSTRSSVSHRSPHPGPADPDTIRQFAQFRSTVGASEHSGTLRKLISKGTNIVISTVQNFPFILDEIGSWHRWPPFAIIIDEAHSSQGGLYPRPRSSMALSPAGDDEEDD